MNKKLIIIILISLILILLILGFVGVKKEVCFYEGKCGSCYNTYILYPYIYDYWDCTCRTFLPICHFSPCGLDIGIDEYNAKAETIKCLCNDKIINKDKIIEFYNKELSDKNLQYPQDSDFICNHIRVMWKI